MSEVKISDSGNLGLFASKTFKAGTVVLEEAPIVVLAKSAESTITVPASVDEKYHDTFRSMVQAGLSWIQQQPKDEKAILELYFPSNESANVYEKDVLKVANEAIKYLQNKSSSEEENWVTIGKIMLVWSCNAFEGGRIYRKISRVNHCCNPNAIIQPAGETQRLVAAADIVQGDEITISYLGTMLYADTQTRNERLKQAKFFECSCDRCSTDDVAARIPCPSCHPRQAQQSLDEDVQYDDDQTVAYVTPSNPCSTCNSKLDEASNLCKFMSNVTPKVVSYLKSQEGTTARKRAEPDAQDDENLEEHVGLASTIMGDKHWTTNLLLLLHLDRRLSSISSAMLTTQELPEMDEIAEVIDSLQRVCRFVESQSLRLHPGHILGDVIIGTARALVSLGDEKSQKYGAEWLEKITDYVNKFENEGRQKVVAALSVAWKERDSDQFNQPTKKLKK